MCKCWQNKGSRHAVTKIIKPNDQFLNFRPKGLDGEKKYHFHNRNVYHNAEELAHYAKAEQIKENSDGFRYIEGEKEDYTGYGNLMMEAGINLKEGFAGSGVNEDIRLMGDFDSRLYYIENI